MDLDPCRLYDVYIITPRSRPVTAVSLFQFYRVQRRVRSGVSGLLCSSVTGGAGGGHRCHRHSVRGALSGRGTPEETVTR